MVPWPDGIRPSRIESLAVTYGGLDSVEPCLNYRWYYGRTESGPPVLARITCGTLAGWNPTLQNRITRRDLWRARLCRALVVSPQALRPDRIQPSRQESLVFDPDRLSTGAVDRLDECVGRFAAAARDTCATAQRSRLTATCVRWKNRHRGCGLHAELLHSPKKFPIFATGSREVGIWAITAAQICSVEAVPPAGGRPRRSVNSSKLSCEMSLGGEKRPPSVSVRTETPKIFNLLCAVPASG